MRERKNLLGITPAEQLFQRRYQVTDIRPLSHAAENDYDGFAALILDQQGNVMTDSNKTAFGLALNMNTRDEATGRELKEQQPATLSIAILGNFSGSNQSDNSGTIAQRGIFEIDRYNFDEIFTRLNPRLSLALDPEDEILTDIPLHSLKDFHPDELYRNVAAFGELRDLRKRLDNPASFAQAMKELNWQDSGEPRSTTPESRQSDTETAREPAPQGDNLIDAILSETQSRTPSSDERIAGQSKSMVDALIRQISGNRERPLSRDSRQDEMVAAIDDEITALMRRILHHPDFQALESAWRGVHFLTRRIRSGKAVKFHLIDLNQDEMMCDLDSDDVSASGLFQLFADPSRGDINWNLMLGVYRFTADIDDLTCLSRMGDIAHRSGATFISAAHEKLIGCADFAQAPKVDDWNYSIRTEVTKLWDTLRKSAAARSVILALPRFMLRAPYGRESERIKSFEFEEMITPPTHNEYLWGNPALLKAEQIARAFIAGDGDIDYRSVMDIEDLPAHFYTSVGNTVVKPCAEIALTDVGASRILAQGLVPLWSVKNSDRIHSGDFHSIASQ